MLFETLKFLMTSSCYSSTDAMSRGGRECFLEQFEIDGRENKQVPYSRETPVEQIDRIANLLTSADDCNIHSIRSPPFNPER